jgi:hypothetical protein
MDRSNAGISGGLGRTLTASGATHVASQELEGFGLVSRAPPAPELHFFPPPLPVSRDCAHRINGCSFDRVRHVLPAIWFAGFQISKEQSAGFDILWTPPA